MAYWAVPYPVDTVKSSIVAGTHGLPAGVPPTLANVAKKLYADGGLRALYRGCPLTVARAAPGNAILFTVCEAVQRRLSPPPK
ncbi:hypothetical protein JL720_9940 [Aureococcus anophagefferens]|nr:hypothetical protein JL720_9940 [Aureococcus anophagefferens]